MTLFLIACVLIVGVVMLCVGRYLLMPQPQPETGLIRCRRCGRLIPKGFGHRRGPGIEGCEVVDRSHRN